MVVKSMVVGQAHASFPNRGGLHHYYANDKAVAGYRTGTFPDGAIVVDEAVFTKEGEGRATGLLLEGERRFLDVMVKDAERYKSTGGWGYEHFEADEKTGRLADAERGTCATCHAKAPADHVFSRSDREVGDHIVSRAAISSMPSHRFCRRRFSSKLCWLLS